MGKDTSKLDRAQPSRYILKSGGVVRGMSQLDRVQEGGPGHLEYLKMAMRSANKGFDMDIFGIVLGGRVLRRSRAREYQ